MNQKGSAFLGSTLIPLVLLIKAFGQLSLIPWIWLCHPIFILEETVIKSDSILLAVKSYLLFSFTGHCSGQRVSIWKTSHVKCYSHQPLPLQRGTQGFGITLGSSSFFSRGPINRRNEIIRLSFCIWLILFVYTFLVHCT